MKKLTYVLIPSLAYLLLACGGSSDSEYQITPADLEGHIIELSNDLYAGRMPFTDGETKTLTYMEKIFSEIGAEPGNGESYYQDVPMVSITSKAAPTMQVKGPKGSIELKGLEDYVLWTQRIEEEQIFEDVELVFVGYGIVAPEYGWNDYQDVDMSGKIAVVIVNDPGYGQEGSDLFNGNTMTYYGRWTYKFEEAARQGALGTLIIHETGAAGYGFGVVQNGWNGTKLYLDNRGKDIYQPKFEGWITSETAEKLVDLAGLSIHELFQQAKTSEFKALPMGLKVSSSVSAQGIFDSSKNFIAKITGTKRPNEYIIYTAHWDHLGIGSPDASGDSIYNGALDNASGIAAMWALAKGFIEGEKPERTVVFLAVTAEEQGLWGSAYYAQNPVYPASQTVANINIDGLNIFGSMRDMTLIGKGQSDLEDLLDAVLSEKNRFSTPDPTPAAGLYYRSDHFNFAKIGVPALYVGAGTDHVEFGVEYGKQQMADYITNHYHKPSDKYDAEAWDLDSAVEDLMVLFKVGKKLSNTTS
ncbi:M28 family metallopeptidase [Mongoliitalea daihaiensis]|uniref:M28 family metallopeptidase n=1 Tax=Mongoliitalea daihaiensis TaxID=2782006 RepID=UPI001F2A092F|nr:M28 family metallopeptidase [Mongoliitalea daihaiensis]UJP64349.1 M28 family peptidase [Mongoliitalea daihaiensis]